MRVTLDPYHLIPDADRSDNVITYAFSVWERVIDLMPLRNLLKVIDCTKKPDNIITEQELGLAMKNSTVADIDGDTKAISEDEMAIYLRIQALNQDPDLITHVLMGDYSNISESTLMELQSLSDEVKRLKPKT